MKHFIAIFVILLSLLCPSWVFAAKSSMALDPVTNFAKCRVTTGYTSSVTSIAVSAGCGATLPQPSTDGAFNLVWWNATDYADSSDDPSREIVRVTARSTDTLTISRAQESTTAKNHNTGGKTYYVALAPTKKLIDDINSLFETSTGHDHDGINSPFISTTAISKYNLSGTNVTVSGGSSSVLTNDVAISIPQSVATTADTIFNSTTLSNTGLKLKDLSGNYTSNLKIGSTLGGNRTLSIEQGDADRNLTLTGNATLNQDVSTAGSPAFPGLTIGSTLSFSAASITDSTGAISFGNENLTTTGTLGAGAITGTSVTPSNLTTGYIPYKPAGALANSPIYTNGTGVRIGPSGSGSMAPMEVVYATSGGIALTSKDTSPGTEVYIAGFLIDATPSYQRVGSESFSWTDTNVVDGYASWNVKTSAYTASVINDYVGLAIWAKHGAAFFPGGVTSGFAPGANLLKVNGGLIVTDLTDTYIPYHQTDALGFGNSAFRSNGTVASVGAAYGTAIGFRVGGDITAGVAQYGNFFDSTLGGTTQSNVVYIAGTIKADTAVTSWTGARFENPDLGSGATVTNQYQLYIGTPTHGSSVNEAIHVVGGISYFGGNVGMKTASPGSELDVKGTLRVTASDGTYVGFNTGAGTTSKEYTLPSVDGSSGWVLTTNGSGVLTFVAPGGTAGTHDGVDDSAFLHDSTKSWTNDQWIGYTVKNLTDISSCVITDNDSHTVTCTLGGGTQNDWDIGDTYVIVGAVGITSINGASGAAQTIAPGSGISVTTVGNTHTIAYNPASTLTLGVASTTTGILRLYNAGGAGYTDLSNTASASNFTVLLPPASGTLATVAGLTDYYVPYELSDALVDSPLRTDGTRVAIGIAASAAAVLYSSGDITAGTTQYGLFVDNTFSGTVQTNAVITGGKVKASTTVVDWASICIINPDLLGSGETLAHITNEYMLWIDAPIHGDTINQAIHVAGGTSYFGGNVNVNGLTVSKPVFTDASKNLVSTGTLGVDQGGTGLTSLTTGYIPFGAGTDAFGNSANLTWDDTNGLSLLKKATITKADATLGQLRLGYDADTHWVDFIVNSAGVLSWEFSGTPVINFAQTTIHVGGLFGLLESSGATFYSYLSAGDQSYDIVYTLPPTVPDGVSWLKSTSSTIGGTSYSVWSWDTTVPALKGGTPANTYVAYWTDANTISGESGLIYDSTTNTFSVVQTASANLSMYLKGRNEYKSDIYFYNNDLSSIKGRIGTKYNPNTFSLGYGDTEQIIMGSAGKIDLTAIGTNQNITLTPSGTGVVSIVGPLSATTFRESWSVDADFPLTDSEYTPNTGWAYAGMTKYSSSVIKATTARTGVAGDTLENGLAIYGRTDDPASTSDKYWHSFNSLLITAHGLGVSSPQYRDINTIQLAGMANTIGIKNINLLVGDAIQYGTGGATGFELWAWNPISAASQAGSLCGGEVILVAEKGDNDSTHSYRGFEVVNKGKVAYAAYNIITDTTLGHAGTFWYGIIFSNATFTQSAIQLSSNQKICWGSKCFYSDGTDLYWDGTKITVP